LLARPRRSTPPCTIRRDSCWPKSSTATRRRLPDPGGGVAAVEENLPPCCATCRDVLLVRPSLGTLYPVTVLLFPTSTDHEVYDDGQRLGPGDRRSRPSAERTRHAVRVRSAHPDGVDRQLLGRRGGARPRERRLVPLRDPHP